MVKVVAKVSLENARECESGCVFRGPKVYEGCLKGLSDCNEETRELYNVEGQSIL